MQPSIATKLKKDIKRVKKMGKNTDKLKAVMDLIIVKKMKKNYLLTQLL